MKHQLALLLLLLAATANLQAQNVAIEGKVVTKKGEPVPGARVALEGTTENVLTNLDGTFALPWQAGTSMVAVKYVGMQPKRQRRTDDMTIVLSRTTWWNRVPDHYQFYVAPQVAFPEKGMKQPAVGLAVGIMKTWGAYVKALYSKVPSTDYEWDDFAYPEGTHLPWTTGERKSGMMAFVAGGSVRLGCAINLNLGVGYMKAVQAWQLADGEHYTTYNPDSHNGLCLDAGLMLRLGTHLFVNGGLLYGSKQAMAPTAGIGYCF